jgi:hypothetical protein
LRAKRSNPEPRQRSQALNNANNVVDYYRDKNEEVDVDATSGRNLLWQQFERYQP